jgi:hypothetical protein
MIVRPFGDREAAVENFVPRKAGFKIISKFRKKIYETTVSRPFPNV